MDTLANLAKQLYLAKQEESRAKKARIAVEEQIADMVDTPENGSVTVEADALKINVKRALTYTGDTDALLADMGDDAPCELIPEKWAFSPSKYERLRKENQELFERACRHVVTKPRKVAVTLKLA